MARLANRFSLGARLFLSAVLCCAVVLATAGAGLTTFYRRAAERGFDERLDVHIKGLIADLAAPPEREGRKVGDLGEPRFELPLSGWYWQTVRLDGERQTIRASRSLVGGQLPKLLDRNTDPNARGLREAYISGPDDRTLRLLEREIDVGDDGRFTVGVAAPADELDDDIKGFRDALTLTFVLLGLALVASTLLQVRFGLRPLVRLGQAVATVRRGDAPRIPGEYPSDLAPLAGELNQLIDSNTEILERARTQVGNLAHALKTPLSVMLNEAEAARDGGALPETVRTQAAIMRDQVQYYLDRARAAALSGALGGATEVAPSLDALIRTFDRISRGRVSASHHVDPGLRFRGERQDLEEMLGNLLDNAFKWAKQRVDVGAEEVAGSPPRMAFLIDDDGPGLPPEAMTEVLWRGRRLDETTPGSGLGLSIVVDLAKLYGGDLRLEPSPLGGLRARLTLPVLSER